MSSFKTDKFDLLEIEKVMSKGEYELALDLIKKIEEKNTAFGAYILWQKGVSLDYLGYPMDALRSFKKALELDPSSYPCLNSLDITLENMQKQLRRMESDETINLEFIIEIESFLKEIGELSSGFQLRLLRHYLILKAYNEFDSLIGYSLDLNPNSRELAELKDLRGTEGFLKIAN